MISKYTKNLTLAGLFLIAMSGAMPAAWAAGGGYLGASFGKTDIDASVTEGLITSGTTDGKDSGFKVFGGSQVNENLAVEIAYVNLGELTYSGSFLGTPVTGGKVKITGLNFGVVGALPVNANFSVLGRVGFFMWDAKASDTTGGVPFSATDDGMDLSFGVGVNYDFTKNFAVRAEWEGFDAANANASLLSIGLLYKF